MKKVPKSIVHKVVTFLNAVIENQNISVSISFSLRYTHVDVFAHYFRNSDIVNTFHYSVNNNNFIKFKDSMIEWIDKTEEEYGTKH